MIQKKTKKPFWNAWIRHGVLICLIASAAWLWWTEGREGPEETAVPEPSATPAVRRDERLKREASFENDAAALRAIVDGESADEATRNMAAQTLTELITEHQNELGLETALQEAGYTSAVVLVQSGAVTVMIPQEMLTEETSMQILALCIAHTDAGAENVRVMALR